MSLGAQSTATVSVLAATILALSLAGAIGVLAGSFVGQLIPPDKIKILSGSMFIFVGLWILIKK